MWKRLWEKLKRTPFWQKYGLLIEFAPALVALTLIFCDGARAGLVNLLFPNPKIELSPRGQVIVICGVNLVTWAGIGLLFGRFVSGWFPFLMTRKIYLPIPGKFLPRLLIGEDNLYWGRTRPRYLPEQYYRVSPENRNKMSIWGMLFYTGWLVITALLVFSSSGKLPLGGIPFFLLLLWPTLILGLGNLDYSRGFHRVAEARKKEKQ